MDAHRMYDIRVLSTLGLTEADIAAIRSMDGVDRAAGLYRLDAVVATLRQDIVISALTLDASGMNSPEVLSGRLPAAPDECAVEARFLEQTDLKLGDSFSFKEVQAGFEKALSQKTFKIVGLVRSPLYIAKIQRGSTTLGSGSVSAYVILPKGAVKLDYFTELDVAVAGAKGETTYTTAYKNTIQPVRDSLEALGPTQAARRRDDLSAKANADLTSAKAELRDKQAELEDAKKQLSDAKAELADGQKQLAEQKAQADAEFQKARDKLDASSQDIQNGDAGLTAAQAQLDAQKAAGDSQLASAKSDLDGKQAALNAAFDAYKQVHTQFEAQLAQWNALPAAVRAAQPDKQKQLDDAQRQLDAQKQQLDGQ
jgi:putative ABC transport system permease protein